MIRKSVKCSAKLSRKKSINLCVAVSSNLREKVVLVAVAVYVP
jgi:hypothetical protein